MIERIARAWRALSRDERIAAISSFGLLVSMFLPWYVLTSRGPGGLSTQSLSAFRDFSWVEAAVLLVGAAVCVLLFARAERRPFHLPGGDGSVIAAAGGWVTLLLIWRAFDKPGGTTISAVGLSWGFVAAFAAAGSLTYAGLRIRAAHRPEPPLPGESPAPPPAAPAPESPPPTAATQPIRHDPPTAATEAIPPRPRRRSPAPPPPASPSSPSKKPDLERDQLAMELTQAHGSEEPLPRDDLTSELFDERSERRER
jgi:hypothetical protein